MGRYSISLSKELEEKAKELVGKDKRFGTVSQLLKHALIRYFDDMDVRRSYRHSGMALSLQHKPGELELDEETKKKMRKALGIDEDD
jgi:Arc/MetJ-type ribon-helix-helix transcriptional regulator